MSADAYSAQLALFSFRPVWASFVLLFMLLPKLNRKGCWMIKRKSFNTERVSYPRLAPRFSYVVRLSSTAQQRRR